MEGLSTEVTSGSAADKATLRQGDIIVAIDGKSISTQEELVEYLNGCSVGDEITLKVYKINADEYGYDLSDVVVTLQGKPDN